MSPGSFRHGAVIANISGPLIQFVKAHRLGVVVGAETGFKLASDPDTVLGPDVAFVLKKRIPAKGIEKGFFPGPPDLAVEVMSPSDTAEEVEEKVRIYLDAGPRMVLVANPKLRTLTVYRSLKKIRILTSADTFDGDDLIPGFRIPVAEIFE